jgi:hypothetical protein
MREGRGKERGLTLLYLLNLRLHSDKRQLMRLPFFRNVNIYAREKV